jgi:hypothetical protein
MNGTATEFISSGTSYVEGSEVHLLMAADHDRSEIDAIWEAERTKRESVQHKELLDAVQGVRADVTRAIDALRAEVGRIDGNVRAQDKRLIWLEATEEERKRQAAIRGVAVGVEPPPTPRIPPAAKHAGMGAGGMAGLIGIFEILARLFGWTSIFSG